MNLYSEQLINYLIFIKWKNGTCSASLTLGERSQKCNHLYILCRESPSNSVQSTKGRRGKKDWGWQGIEHLISGKGEK